MEKIKVYIVLSLLMMYGHNMYAQIGYQISLLNTATGEPRANETVNVTMTLTNSEGKVIYTGNQSATTNDFGVLSLTIGDADTFKEVDVTKMPFYVEVSANGVSIGKSQVLSVPVAEVAKRLAPLDDDLLLGTWNGSYLYSDDRYMTKYECSITFQGNGLVSYKLNQQVYESGKLHYEVTSKITFNYLSSGLSIILYNGSGTDTVIYYHSDDPPTTETRVSSPGVRTLIYTTDFIVLQAATPGNFILKRG